ncbi:MAG: c-type cytochrome [Myxococcota bacterium]|nr:c-type cytochrome [Myxococcota bacterium]
MLRILLILSCASSSSKKPSETPSKSKIVEQAKAEQRLASSDVSEKSSQEIGTTEKVEEPARSGKEVYQGVCQQCHQNEGQGIPGLYPPLAGSEWPVKEASIPIRIVLHGLRGPISVKGQTYGTMQMAAQGSLSDDEIASVLSFVRRSWGNQAEPITADQVRSVREQYSTRGAKMWTAEELSSVQ